MTRPKRPVRRIALRHRPYRESFGPRRRDGPVSNARHAPLRKSLEVGALSAADPLNISGTARSRPTTVPSGGRAGLPRRRPVASKHGRDPHERGSRPHHRMGCPRGPAPSRRRGQPALGGRRGTTTPVRRAALQRVGAFPAVPAGRRTLDRHRRISRRGTGHHPKTYPWAPTTTSCPE